MRVIHLLPIGELDLALLETLRASLAAVFGVRCELLGGPTRAELAGSLREAFHAGREQHHSSRLLDWMRTLHRPGSWRLLGVTPFDLYIPTLTFVFGEAELGSACAVVSVHRLRQEFYGLPGEPTLLCRRLLKESLHELGHTFELTHCDDYRCAMAPSHAVEWIDLKEADFCASCRQRIQNWAQQASGRTVGG